MADLRTVTTLKSKRDKILASNRLSEGELEQARADVVHIDAVIRLFRATRDPKDMSRLWAHIAALPADATFDQLAERLKEHGFEGKWRASRTNSSARP